MSQKPAKVPTPADEKSNVGKHEDDIKWGSRLARTLEAQGVAPVDGKDESKQTTPTISESRFARIMQGKRFMKRVKWPDMDCSGDDPVDVEIGIVVLTEEEIEEAAIAASARLADAKNTLGNLDYSERLARESAVQVLWRAVLDAETLRPFALNADEMRRMIPARVLDWLWIQYVEHQEDTSPLSQPLTKKEADAIIEDLKKGRWGQQIESLDSASLLTLLRLSAGLLQNSHSSND